MVLFALALGGSTSLWHLLRHALWYIALLGSFTSTIFLGMVLMAAIGYALNCRRAQKIIQNLSANLPPVAIVKPLHGMEPELEANLESFFRQDYPGFEIVFGARSSDDPSLRVVERLQSRYPQVQASVVISGEPCWPNAKVFSLDKMLECCSSRLVVISDSDVFVGPDFLRNVVPPLLRPNVGLVTCLYKGIPANGALSHLDALGMSIEMPSGVLVADMLEGMRFALGAVMAVRRDVLEAIGGIRPLADFCADDFVLGNRISKAGFEVVLSHYKVGHVLPARSLAQVLGDELRWMRSTRFSRPKGHLGSGLTYAVPFGLMGLLLAMGHSRILHAGIDLFVLSVLNRILLALIVGWGIMRDRNSLRLCWLNPLRDLLSFGLWLASFSGETFLWRGETYRLAEQGRIVPEQRPITILAALPQIQKKVG
jgi:ceramide glucosyltransferase